MESHQAQMNFQTRIRILQDSAQFFKQHFRNFKQKQFFMQIFFLSITFDDNFLSKLMVSSGTEYLFGSGSGSQLFHKLLS